jgi:hypothetical protein
VLGVIARAVLIARSLLQRCGDRSVSTVHRCACLAVVWPTFTSAALCASVLQPLAQHEFFFGRDTSLGPGSRIQVNNVVITVVVQTSARLRQRSEVHDSTSKAPEAPAKPAAPVATPAAIKAPEEPATPAAPAAKPEAAALPAKVVPAAPVKPAAPAAKPAAIKAPEKPATPAAPAAKPEAAALPAKVVPAAPVKPAAPAAKPATAEPKAPEAPAKFAAPAAKPAPPAKPIATAEEAAAWAARIPKQVRPPPPVQLSSQEGVDTQPAKPVAAQP